MNGSGTRKLRVIAACAVILIGLLFGLSVLRGTFRPAVASIAIDAVAIFVIGIGILLLVGFSGRRASGRQRTPLDLRKKRRYIRVMSRSVLAIYAGLAAAVPVASDLLRGRPVTTQDVTLLAIFVLLTGGGIFLNVWARDRLLEMSGPLE